MTITKLEPKSALAATMFVQASEYLGLVLSIAGAVDVHVIGTNFVNTPDLKCVYKLFDDSVELEHITTTYVNATHVVCKVPQASIAYRGRISLDFCGGKKYSDAFSAEVRWMKELPTISYSRFMRSCNNFGIKFSGPVDIKDGSTLNCVTLFPTDHTKLGGQAVCSFADTSTLDVQMLGSPTFTAGNVLHLDLSKLQARGASATKYPASTNLSVTIAQPSPAINPDFRLEGISNVGE